MGDLMLSKLRVPILLLVVVTLLFGGVLMVPRHDASSHHVAPVKHEPQYEVTGLDVQQSATMVDAAGARCASSADVTKCHDEPLFPVHPGGATDTIRTLYSRNLAGKYVVSSCDPQCWPGVNIGDPVPTQTAAVASGAGKVVLVGHEYQQTFGWRHFPCYCNNGKVLLRIQVHYVSACYSFCHDGVKLGSYYLKFPIYTQDLFGFFAQGYAFTDIYNHAVYWSGADAGIHNPGWAGQACNCATYGPLYFNCCGYWRSAVRYRDNILFGDNNCGVTFMAGDMMFTSNGDYTMTGWIDRQDFPPHFCVSINPGANDGTHMA